MERKFMTLNSIHALASVVTVSLSRIWGLLLLSLVVAGCGTSGLPTAIVRGQVTFNRQPVNNGDVMFYPEGDSKGPTSGASIKDGEYIVENKGGVVLGSHRVVIRAFRAGSSPVPEAENEFGGGRREQYLPVKYSDQRGSELTVTITADKATHQQDFHLQP